MSASNEWWLIAGAVAVGFMTKPSDQDLMNKLVTDVRNTFASSEAMRLNKDDSFLSGLSKFGCAIDYNTCATIFVSSLDVKTGTLGPLRMAKIKDNSGKELVSCYGAFKNWWCP